MSKTDVLDLLNDWYDAVPSRQQMEWEIRKYQAYKRLLFDSLHVKEGDRVRITDSWKGVSEGSGWWPYRECMVPGATASVRKVDYNLSHEFWYADIVFDNEWSVSSYRGLKGDEEPKRYPSEPDKRHYFSFPLKHLETIK